VKKQNPGPTAVPEDVRAAFDRIVGLTDGFCRHHLTDEYAALCRRLAEKLARKRPSPLKAGKPETWACGIVRTVGWVNFLDDPGRTPHMKLTAIDKAFGVGESTGQGKSKAIRTLLKIRQFGHEWVLPSQLGDPGQAGVHGGDVHRDVVLGLVGGVDRGLDPAHDRRHQIHTGGEQELAVVPISGDADEQVVEVGRVEGVLERTPDGDGHRAPLDEPLNDSVQ
jgi:hypothetical protein